ncbi:ankyrin repeat domain-containing protein [Ralstonia mannitolilytica]|uniref:ankyrin repeat domain-containing protein n=1 Tax=Ralstonia mannitolilytica TaxID=105219 RepID=UPI0037491332
MPNHVNENGEVALMDALAADDLKTAKEIMSTQKISATVRDWTRSNMSPLAYAVRRNDAEFVAELIEAGADVNGFAFGDIPLIALANAECAEQLARAGADVNAPIKRDSSSLGLVQGATALIKAAHRDDGKLVAKLIELGADINAVDRFGRTALHYAARSNGVAAKQLLAAGADLLAEDRFGKTPAFYNAAPQLKPVDLRQQGAPVRSAVPTTEQCATARPAKLSHLVLGTAAEEELLQALNGFEYAVGDKLSLDHGEFLYLSGKDVLGEGSRFAVVPRSMSLPVTRFSDEGDLESYLADQQIAMRDRSAVHAFFLISQQRDGLAHEQIAAPPENAIIGIARTVSQDAINLNEYISRIEHDGGLSVGHGTQDGPETLLQGRYVRDGAGQYRRLGEEQIALVDEGDKIRFVDKQTDTFHAAGELAGAKQWQAIQVTGSEKFCADAWFSARLAGLDVIGYEPTAKDLDRLEVAVERGFSNAFAETRHHVTAAGPTREAPKEGPPLASTLHPLAVSGTHIGKVTALSANHLEQKVGRDPRNVVVHDRSVLSGDPVDVGQVVTIKYEMGKGLLSNHDLAVEQRGVGR